MNAAWPLVLRATVTGPLLDAPGRVLLSALGIALGVALGFAVHLINRSAADEMSAATRSLFGTADLSVQGPAAGFDEALYPRIARARGVAVASPVLEVEARVVDRRDTLTVQGLDVFQAARLAPDLALPGSGGGFDLFADDAIYLSPSAARHLGLAAGDRLRLQVGIEPVTLTVKGLLSGSAYPQRIAVMDIGTAQWKLDALGRLTRVDLRVAAGADPARVAQALAAELPPGVQVTTPALEAQEAISLSRSYRANLTALALVALFTGAFLVLSTQALAMVRRRRQAALLRALGVTGRGQLAAILGEGAVIGAVGAAAGVALGYALAALAVSTLGADLGAGYFPGLEPRLAVAPWEWALFFGLGVAVALAGAALPGLEAAKVPPAQALKAGDEEHPLKRLRGHLAGTVLMALAGLALLAPPVAGLPLPGYFAIAAFLVGAVAWMPAFVRFVFARLPVGGSAWYAVAVAHLRGTAGQATVAIAGVLVSFSLMVAMAIMTASFRDSLDAWLERVLPADLYLRAGTGDAGYFSPAVQAAIVTTPGIARAEFTRYRDLLLRPDAPALTLIAKPITPATAASALWLQARAAPATDLPPAWVSEAAADLYGWQPGSRIELPFAGRSHAFEVLGVWRDYARQSGAVVIDLERYRALSGDADAGSASLWLAAGARPDEVAQRLRARLPAQASYDLAQPAEIRAVSLSIFDRTFAVTYVLEAVAVLIGLFGISAAASARVLARRAEFGMLRHVGMTRRQIGAMLGFEGAAMGAAGVAAGLAVGGVIALVLIYVVNRQSFRWSMDLSVPWALLAVLALTLIAAAALTSVWSGRRAMGEDVVRAVKEDW
ncbi:MAG: FtsX-like permease family protein [Pseudomonadota bacterium]